MPSAEIRREGGKQIHEGGDWGVGWGEGEAYIKDREAKCLC